jgi:biofilm PGA synthesis protein PgaD
MKGFRRPAPPPGTIINRPDLQTLAQRLGGYTVNFFGWALYLYLWLPLITLVVWWLDIGFVYEQMVDQEGLDALANVARWYLLIFGLLAASYLGWARYNQWRFRGRERRNPRPAPPLAKIAEDFGVPLKVLQQWRTQRRVVIHLDEGARVTPSPVMLARLRADRDDVSQVVQR